VVALDVCQVGGEGALHQTMSRDALQRDLHVARSVCARVCAGEGGSSTSWSCLKQTLRRIHCEDDAWPERTRGLDFPQATDWILNDSPYNMHVRHEHVGTHTTNACA
jgi:hypothetical protein